LNEIERFGRWSRIAPAFSAGTVSFLRSHTELIDNCLHTKRNTWFKSVYDKMVYQSAPAIMARNMPLPTVEAMENPPYLMASTYPNGPLAIATEGRVLPSNTWFEPRAKVTVPVKDAQEIIGVFGHYDTLTLTFSGSLEGVSHIWAQDLLAEHAVDILSKVKIIGNSLTIPGKLIDSIGTSAGDKGDISVPGLVIRIEGKNLPEGKKSYAVSFVFSHPDKTLTDKQVDKVMKRLIPPTTPVNMTRQQWVQPTGLRFKQH